MGNAIFMDEQSMAATISKIQAMVPTMQAELKQLNGEMLTLFGTWKGRSSQSFQRLHTNWSQDYTNLNQALNGISETLNKNLGNTVNADVNSTVRG
jgi:WXG100 family type VII secretion target